MHLPSSQTHGDGKLDQLLAQRTALEMEAQVISEELQSLPCGIKGSLVDAEGFPLAGIDIYNVRTKRQRLACIQTDYKEVMSALESEVMRLHQEKAAELPPKPPGRTTERPENERRIFAAPCPANGWATLKPFALIDEVFSGSPACDAGIQVGDKLIKFGSADHTNNRGLMALVDVVSSSVGLPVELVIERSGEAGSSRRLEVTLTPHQWQGRGLVGCHFQPIQSL
ncbi:unnamed protein product [Heterosigma akashiwo]